MCDLLQVLRVSGPRSIAFLFTSRGISILVHFPVQHSSDSNVGSVSHPTTSDRIHKESNGYIYSRKINLINHNRVTHEILPAGITVTGVGRGSRRHYTSSKQDRANVHIIQIPGKKDNR